MCIDSGMAALWGMLPISGCWPQVLQAKTKVANGKVFDMAVKLSQGDMPDQIMQVSRDNVCQHWQHVMQMWKCSASSLPVCDIHPLTEDMSWCLA